ncbi:MAG: DUF2400 family protein [Fluviicola sp.]|nr:DUF2400 family protein [Fluviicola sp.]
MTSLQLKEYLDFKAEQYNTKQFIDTDPIQLPHRFSRKEDVEIVAFLVSTIAWGKRAMTNHFSPPTTKYIIEFFLVL